MAENLESGNGQGATGQPTPAASGAGSVSGTSNGNDAVLTEIQAIKKRMEDFERRAQGDKDRAVQGVRREFETWKPVLEKVAAQFNLTPEQVATVQRDMEFDELKRRVFEQPSQPPAQAAPVQDAGEQMFQKALKRYGLDATDPDVVGLMRETSDPEDRLFRLAELGAVRKTAPTPTPGSTPAPSGGTPPKPDLKAEYDREIAANRGNVMAIAEIKKKYRKQGLDVW